MAPAFPELLTTSLCVRQHAVGGPGAQHREQGERKMEHRLIKQEITVPTDAQVHKVYRDRVG